MFAWNRPSLSDVTVTGRVQPTEIVTGVFGVVHPQIGAIAFLWMTAFAMKGLPNRSCPTAETDNRIAQTRRVRFIAYPSELAY
jgi:hypothetical protein